MSSIEIQGQVDDGFSAVADAFAANFVEHGEVGAGFCLYVDGQKRVDIAAGVADTADGRAYDHDTLQLVFSTTKGAAAICIAQLVQAGKLRYDDLVADHWPEFAAGGKGAVTVSQMMSHQAGLFTVDNPPSFDDVLAVTPIVEALAAQAPLWEPGTNHGYHALTYGWLAGELVRRVDGRDIGTYFAEEVAGPLGLDFWIGLPESEEPRVAPLIAAPPPTDMTAEELQLMIQVMGPGTNGNRALTLDGTINALEGDNPFNTREVHATQMPAANGITTAASLARMYAATIGDVDGVRLLNTDTMDAMRAEQVRGPDGCLVMESRFGQGMMLHGELVPLIQDGSYGHAGAGGSLGYANPELGVGYGYVMNQMSAGLAGDPRTIGLNDAVQACL
ncbi:MAG: beta-lactamase family protein [Acidimicrobiales bacterium]|nr:beta-lactamase family protein [Acidimicrobiales bacterium]